VKLFHYTHVTSDLAVHSLDSRSSVPDQCGIAVLAALETG